MFGIPRRTTPPVQLISTPPSPPGVRGRSFVMGSLQLPHQLPSGSWSDHRPAERRPPLGSVHPNPKPPDVSPTRGRLRPVTKATLDQITANLSFVDSLSSVYSLCIRVCEVLYDGTGALLSSLSFACGSDLQFHVTQQHPGASAAAQEPQDALNPQIRSVFLSKSADLVHVRARRFASA